MNRTLRNRLLPLMTGTALAVTMVVAPVALTLGGIKLNTATSDQVFGQRGGGGGSGGPSGGGSGGPGGGGDGGPRPGPDGGPGGGGGGGGAGPDGQGGSGKGGTLEPVQQPCWVARAVYGPDDPAWLEFREWLLIRAPGWLRSLYIAYGPAVAPVVARSRFLRLVLRPMMDKARGSLSA